jgi:uncharacterized protein YndB with AHSA1/START domain
VRPPNEPGPPDPSSVDDHGSGDATEPSPADARDGVTETPPPPPRDPSDPSAPTDAADGGTAPRRGCGIALLWLVLTPVLLAAALMAVGTALPAEHTVARRIDLAAAPERVWAVVTTVDSFAAWRPDVDSVQPLPAVEGRRRWREGVGYGLVTYEATRWEPPAALDAAVVTGPGERRPAFSGRWRYRLERREGGGTRLTVTEHGEIRQPIMRAVARYALGHEGTLNDYLSALAARLGERAAPQPAAPLP